MPRRLSNRRWASVAARRGANGVARRGAGRAIALTRTLPSRWCRRLCRLGHPYFRDQSTHLWVNPSRQSTLRARRDRCFADIKKRPPTNACARLAAEQPIRQPPPRRDRHRRQLEPGRGGVTHRVDPSRAGRLCVQRPPGGRGESAPQPTLSPPSAACLYSRKREKARWQRGRRTHRFDPP